MATDWHNPYAHTASYFVFKSILTIISSFVSISILTIHWIEHNNHKFNDIPLSSLTTTRSRSLSATPSTPTSTKPKKLKKYTLSQTIILRLTWSTIIIFCIICVIFALLTIVEQVARLNKVRVILCNPLTVRVLSSTFQFGVGLMHCLFMAQLYEIYNNTDFAYSPFTIRILSLIIMNLSIGASVIILLYLDVEPYHISWLGQQHSTCNTVVPRFVNIIIGGTELLVALLLLYLFVWPMHGMIRIHKSSKNDIQYPASVIFQVHKITTLTLIATISTFLSTAIIGWTYAMWPSFINMPLNCICLMFMTNYYPNGYKNICCLSTRLRIRLFKHATKKRLRSQGIYHAAHQSSVLPLNDITKQDLQKKQKETEAYLGAHDHNGLQLTDNASYDPYGGKKIHQTQSSIPNNMDDRKLNKDGKYALVNLSSNSELKNVSKALTIPHKNSKHKVANTTEMMIMEISPLGVVKTKSKSPNDTMINRSISDGNNDNKQQLLVDINMSKSPKNKVKKLKMKKDSSFVLSDNDINNLMETIDDHPDHQQMDYQISTSTHL